jgi:integrase
MPKRVPPLSAKTLANIRIGKHAIELADGYVPGLRVRVLPSGTRSWSLNIRNDQGVRRRFDLGAGLSLAEARRKAEDLRRAVRDGADPTAERRAARQRAQAARDGVGTLAALLDTYFSAGPGAELRRAQQAKKLIKAVFAEALGVPLLDIQRPNMQLLADEWASRHSAALAIRSLRPCLKWAEKRGMVQIGVWDLEPPIAGTRRERVLSEDEIRALWPHLQGTPGLVFKWLMWTGCRLNEAAGMTWGEIQSDKWTIPALRSKSKRARTIPLTSQALSLLGEREPRDPNALVFPSARGGLLSNWDRVTKALHTASGTAAWHRHDLRRTVATMLGDLGFAPHVISVVLGHAHVAEGATAVYARSRYQREHQEALQTLAAEFERIVTDEGKVLLLSAAS